MITLVDTTSFVASHAGRVRLARFFGLAAIVAALTLLLAPCASHASEAGVESRGAAHAEAGHEAGGHEAGGHGAGGHEAGGHDAAAHKEHLRHFSLANMLIAEETEKGIRAKLGHAVGMPTSLVDHEDFETQGHLGHVFWAGVALLLILGMAMAARGRIASDADAGVLPATKISPLLFFEVIIGAVWNLMRSMMPAHEAKRYFPIVATSAVYILTMNLLALLPFGAPATDNLNTNIGMGLTIFFATHYAGIRSQGVVHYAQHFMGPVLALAPLMVVIEIVGHLVRPLSLSLRLMGNMTGDHNVLFEFMYFKLPLVPLPVMFLGLMVCVVQTIVFVMLSTVYLSMATAGGHDESHGH